MWVFTRQSFISIAASENSPAYFMIQSRFRNHIEKIFPDAEVTIRHYGLYRYRAMIPKHVVAEKLFGQVEQIDYLDFKSSIPDPKYQTACRDVWATLDKYTPPASKPRKMDVD